MCCFQKKLFKKIIVKKVQEIIMCKSIVWFFPHFFCIFLYQSKKQFGISSYLPLVKCYKISYLWMNFYDVFSVCFRKWDLDQLFPGFTGGLVSFNIIAIQQVWLTNTTFDFCKGTSGVAGAFLTPFAWYYYSI